MTERSPLPEHALALEATRLALPQCLRGIGKAVERDRWQQAREVCPDFCNGTSREA
jgi:hypothetical protein